MIRYRTVHDDGCVQLVVWELDDDVRDSLIQQQQKEIRHLQTCLDWSLEKLEQTGGVPVNS